jgi:hypothetical protein
VLRVVRQDVGAQADFAKALLDQLAHFQRDEFREMLLLLAHQRGRLAQDGLAVGEAAVAPVVFKAVAGLLQPGLEVLVADLVEALDDFAGVGIGGFVRHGISQSKNWKRDTGG